MTEEHFVPQPYTKSLNAGSVTWKSPSNIALVKYWGKYGEQLPKNTSISFTLSNCYTQTQLHFEPKFTDGFDFEVRLDGNREPGFKPKIEQFFQRVETYLPFLSNYKFVIDTHNSFPHSSGIASSASGMSALALCLMSMEAQLSGSMDEQSFKQKASFLARLGSGSASRSIEGPLVVWGDHQAIPQSSQLYGVVYPHSVASVFQDYCDTILLVDKGEKQVSSTVGHGLMVDHPYAQQRFEEADQNIARIQSILAEGDLDGFIALVESEALQLHAMMMTSHPYFILMKPNTLEIIQQIWAYRKATGSKVCFTLDAGANVHVLYPQSEKVAIQDWIAQTLSSYCKNGEFIHDQAALGAEQMKQSL